MKVKVITLTREKERLRKSVHYEDQEEKPVEGVSGPYTKVSIRLKGFKDEEDLRKYFK